MKQFILIFSLLLIPVFCFAGENDFADISSITVPVPQIDYIGNYINLKDAIDTISSIQTTLMINTAQVLDDGERLTVPATITLWFTGNGSIDGVAGGNIETITINGPIDAGPVQIFGSNLTVTIGNSVKEVFPQWWGAENDGTDASGTTAALQACLDTLKPCTLIPGTYLHNKITF